MKNRFSEGHLGLMLFLFIVAMLMLAVGCITDAAADSLGYGVLPNDQTVCVNRSG